MGSDFWLYMKFVDNILDNAHVTPASTTGFTTIGFFGMHCSNSRECPLRVDKRMKCLIARTRLVAFINALETLPNSPVIPTFLVQMIHPATCDKCDFYKTVTIMNILGEIFQFLSYITASGKLQRA